MPALVVHRSLRKGWAGLRWVAVPTGGGRRRAPGKQARPAAQSFASADRISRRGPEMPLRFLTLSRAGRGMTGRREFPSGTAPTREGQRDKVARSPERRSGQVIRPTQTRLPADFARRVAPTSRDAGRERPGESADCGS